MKVGTYIITSNKTETNQGLVPGVLVKYSANTSFVTGTLMLSFCYVCELEALIIVFALCRQGRSLGLFRSPLSLCVVSIKKQDSQLNNSTAPKGTN